MSRKGLLIRGKVYLFFIFFVSNLYAQENQLWFNYALSIRPNTSWSYGGDVGVRGLVSNEDWNQVLIRPTVSYRFSQIFGVSGAVAVFHSINDGPDNDNTEFRIHQDFNINWPDINILRLFYRLRVEQRWFTYQLEAIPNEFNVRVRYLIGAESADIFLFGSKRPIYFQAILEGFKNLSDDEALEVFVNRTRTHFAFGHRISDKFLYEFHYINQESRRLSGDGFKTTENIFRLRTFHRIRYKEKDEEE